MGSFSDGSSRNKMSLLLRGCFGCCRESDKLSEKKSKKARSSLINRVRIRCLQRTDASKTEVYKPTDERNGLLFRVRDTMKWPLFGMTGRCTIFLRNFNLNRRYFQALKSEGLLVTIASSVASPVLNIAWLFTDSELTNTRQSFHSSCQKSHWDVVMYAGITMEMKANFNYDHVNEPILDGIPCSYWLKWIEPTIPLILDLFSMRHRKTNLSRLRSVNYAYEDFMTHHGDTFMEQLDPDMQGPHQLLVNRIYNTPFPTMELGTTAALVHNAMVNREHQFQEPFRSRRPNHRSRCTTRPRPVAIPIQHGWTTELEPDLVPDPNGFIITQDSTAFEADPDYPDRLEDRDPHWYVPVILQLAACSQLQFPDGCSYRSDDDIDVSESSDKDAACYKEQFLNVGNTSSGNDIVERPGMNAACLPTQFIGVSFDDAAAGCSGIGIEPCSSCKSETDEVLTTEDDTSGIAWALSEMCDERYVEEYVDLILKTAVSSIGSIQGRLENAYDLPPWYSSAIDISEHILTTTPRSPSNIVRGLDEACIATQDTEEQNMSCSPWTSLYRDECVVDEMALMNSNQSASHRRLIVHSDHCTREDFLKQVFSKSALSAVKGGTVVPKNECFPEDCLSVELAMLNMNQSAVRLHTHHRFRHRCEHSPDTWFYHGNEHVYQPEKLRPDSSELQFQKQTINLYLKGMPNASICNPIAPDILKTFEGRKGPLGRRFFVNCATELLNEIDKEESTRWVPVRTQKWELRNRSEVSVAPEMEAAYSLSELRNRHRCSVLEKTQTKHTTVDGERRKAVLKKKRKSKRQNTINVSKSRERKETSRSADESTEDTDDDPRESNITILQTDRERKKENCIRSCGDELQGSTFPLLETCTLPEGTHPVGCDKEEGICLFNEKTHSAEYERPEEIWQRHIQNQTRLLTTAENVELTNHIKADVGNKVHSNRTATSYPVRKRYPRRADQQRNLQANLAGGSRSGDKYNLSRAEQRGEGRNTKVNTSNHDSYDGKHSPLHRKSHSQNSTSIVQCATASRQAHISKQNLLYSTLNHLSQSTKEDTNNRKQRTCVEENEEVTSTKVQPSVSTDQTKVSPENCLAFVKDDSYINTNDMQHGICPSFLGSQLSIDDQKVYSSSANDADSSSSDTKDEPKKKSKVCRRKKRMDTVQRKQATVVTETGLYDHGISRCFLSNESKHILALKHNEKSKPLTSDEGSSLSESDSRQSLNENSEANTIPSFDRCQNKMDQSKRTVSLSLSETEVSQTSFYSEATDYDDVNCIDSNVQADTSSTSFEVSDCKDAGSEDCKGESSSIGWNDSNCFEKEDFSYDTDVSSSDSFLGDEGYVIVNLSETFHSDSITSLESYANQQTVDSGHLETKLGSGFFSSDCSMEYSSGKENDGVTTNSLPLCYKDNGDDCHEDWGVSLHSAYVSDRNDAKHSSDAESSAFAAQNENLDSDGTVINEEFDRKGIVNDLNSERDSISQAIQDRIPFKYQQISEGTSASSVNVDQNGSSSTETDVKGNGQDKRVSEDTSYNDAMEESREMSAEIQDQSSSASGSEGCSVIYFDTDDDMPVKLRDEQARRYYDVGDWVTSVDAVRRHRESRRQRGILQYQWNGMFVLSHMYHNHLGQRIRRRRVQFRAWLDRRQRRSDSDISD